jgi:hypothetical protein
MLILAAFLAGIAGANIVIALRRQEEPAHRVSALVIALGCLAAAAAVASMVREPFTQGVP